MTPLIGYFHANSSPEHGHIARQIKYENFPIHFVWNAQEKTWTRRVRGSDPNRPEAIGRMVSIHPNNRETFYLRLLLKHVPGSTSFEHLREVNGTQHATFRDACIALELCEDDSQWVACMTEATEITAPRGLRTLFCNILINCDPTKPEDLFEQFQGVMSEDYLRQRRVDVLSTEDELKRQARNDLLVAINDILHQHNKTNADFHLEVPNDNLSAGPINNSSEIDPNASEFYHQNYQFLNEEQEEIYNIITGHIERDEGGLYTFDAPGGSGKTFLSNIILAYIRMNGKIAIATAMSGIAATLLTMGSTFHRRMAAPIPCQATSTSKLKLNSNEARLIKEAALIIVDEVSMMDYKLLDLLDRFLRVLMENDTFMGGKLIVLMHDFRQILPVVPRGSRATIVSTSVMSSEAWAQFKSLHLTRNMRVERLIQQANSSSERIERLRKYSEWLLSAGDGTAPSLIEKNNIIEVPPQMVCNTKKELEAKVFDNFLQNYQDEEYLSGRAIMSSTNDTIQQCNYEMIDRLPGEMITSYSVDTCVEPDNIARYDSDFLNRVNASGIPPHRLALKVGACIILIRNLSVKDGHCNGTRYIILHMTRHLIKARKLGGGPNSEILIPRIPMISKDTDFPVPFKRLQFPVLGAYYLTLNRAQGQTLKRAGLYLPTSVFCHGHLYVGFSRCGDPDCVFVFADQKEFESIRRLLPPNVTVTRNVVYKEIFQRYSLLG